MPLYEYILPDLRQPAHMCAAAPIRVSSLSVTSHLWPETLCPCAVNVSSLGDLYYSCECCPYLYHIDRKVRTSAVCLLALQFAAPHWSPGGCWAQ